MRYMAIILTVLISGPNLFARCPSPDVVGYSVSILNPDSEGIAEHYKQVPQRIVNSMDKETAMVVRNVVIAKDFIATLKMLQSDSKNNPIKVLEEELTASTKCSYYLITPLTERFFVSFEMLR